MKCMHTAPAGVAFKNELAKEVVETFLELRSAFVDADLGYHRFPPTSPFGQSSPNR